MGILRWIGRGLLLVLIAVLALWAWGMPRAELRGVWQQEWGGNYLRLTRTRAEIYHSNAAGCTLSMAFPAHLPLLRQLEGADIRSLGTDSLIIDVAGLVDDWTYSKVAALPGACLTEGPATPAAVFDAMWQAMNDHYAFFDLWGVDWQAVRALAPAPDEAMSDEALFMRLSEALSGFEDGHIQLIGGPGFYSPEPEPEWLKAEGLEPARLAETAAATFGAPLERLGDAPVRVGLREDGIGYVEISGMWIETGLGTTEVEAAYDIAASIADRLTDARAIVIDIRYNGGGTDGVSLAYASVFTDQRQVVFSKRSRIGAGWSDWSEATLSPHPSGAHLPQPVIVLTSDVTASAAEIFAITLRSLPQASLMGEPTGGGLSDILSLTLPNGWAFGLSNQEYVTASGERFEKVGVPPDIPTQIDGPALAAGTDSLLAAALARLSD